MYTSFTALMLLTSAFEVLVVNMFLAEFLTDKRPFATHKARLSTLVYMLAVIAVNVSEFPPAVILIANFALAFAYSFIYSKKVKLNLFASLIVIGMILIAEVLSFVAIFTFADCTPKTILEDKHLFVLGTMFSRVLSFLGLKLISLLKKNHTDVLPNGYWSAFIVLPVINILGVFFVALATKYDLSDEMLHLGLAVILGNLYSTLIVMYLFDSIVEKSKIKYKSIALSNKLSYQTNHYKEFEVANKEARKIRHDIKNRLIGIKEYIKEGNLDKASESIDLIFENMKNSKNIINTGNSTLDSILFYKKILAESYNIDLKYDIQVPIGIMLDGSDGCILLSDSIDNAIEANLKLRDGSKRYIECLILFRKNGLLCKIKNPVSGAQADVANSELLWAGLENVNAIVEKYNGTVNMNIQNNVAELSFILLAEI